VNELAYDVVIVGSGAGGGTVAQALAPLAQQGQRVLVVEQGPRLRSFEFTGRESEMSAALYRDGGAFLTADGTISLAFAQLYGGSTVVCTGTSLLATERTIRDWHVPGLAWADLEWRSRKYLAQNSAHLIPPDDINDNNRLFAEGARAAGFDVEQFPVNVSGCRGSSLCNLGCPNGAKQGTHVVQLPAAERAGVEVVTRAEAVRVEERAVVVRVRQAMPGEKGAPGEWEPGEYRVRARIIVLAGGAAGTTALLLRSPISRRIPHIGTGFTCHPSLIMVAEHDAPITNDVGHPKSFYVDHADAGGYVLESCMYPPFVVARSLTGFGADHSRMMRAFPRLQMILAFACDRTTANNRIAVDDTGQPVVYYKLTAEVTQSLAAATRAAARIFFAAGARRVHVPAADPPLLERADAARLDTRIDASHVIPGTTSISSAHLMGGCAMGPPHQAVTDAWGRVHGIPWLRVADASLFPDAARINPYVTVMALADRVGEAVRGDVGVLGAITAR
jgi:choline dehydrogenase-like flavoprotein